jgi:hypothetical protein
MRTILCYGDSNTWGYEPATGKRFPEDMRWPGVLARELGSGFRVIEEALNGRTTVRDDPVEEYKSGKDYLTPTTSRLASSPLPLTPRMEQAS